MGFILNRPVLISADCFVSPTEKFCKTSLTESILFSYSSDFFRQKKLMTSCNHKNILYFLVKLLDTKIDCMVTFTQ